MKINNHMKMRNCLRIPVVVVTILFASALAGCGSAGTTDVSASGGSSGISDYGVRHTRTWYFGRGAMPTPRNGGPVDAALAALDFNSSSVSITSTSGSAVVKLHLEDGTMAANAFPWVRSGQQIIFQNPSAVNTWLANYWGDAEGFTVEVQGQSTSEPGPDLLVSEPVYASQTYGGGTASWFLICDPGDPNCVEP